MSFLDRLQVMAKRGANAATQAINEAQSGAHLQGFSLENECKKSAKTLTSFLADDDDPSSALNTIPKAVLKGAHGLAIFTVLKAGFVWSGKIGSGVVLSRLADGSWSAPSCLATGGVGIGAQIGANLSEFVIVLNSPEAVRAFSKGGNLTIGGDLAATAGPIGVGGALSMSLVNPAPMFTYSKSAGVYIGVSVEGTILIERRDANAFYGPGTRCEDLLSGKIPPPEAAALLYEAIERAEGLENENHLPESGAYTVPQPQSFSQSSTVFSADEVTK